MKSKSQQPTKVETKKKPANANHDKSKVREIVGTGLSLLGGLVLAYTTFFPHKISLWIGFAGALLVLAGIAIVAHSHIPSKYLYSAMVVLAAIAFRVTIYLQNLNQTVETPAQTQMVPTARDSMKEAPPHTTTNKEFSRRPDAKLSNRVKTLSSPVIATQSDSIIMKMLVNLQTRSEIAVETKSPELNTGRFPVKVTFKNEGAPADNFTSATLMRVVPRAYIDIFFQSRGGYWGVTKARLIRNNPLFADVSLPDELDSAAVCAVCNDSLIICLRSIVIYRNSEKWDTLDFPYTYSRSKKTFVNYIPPSQNK